MISIFVSLAISCSLVSNKIDLLLCSDSLQSDLIHDFLVLWSQVYIPNYIICVMLTFDRNKGNLDNCSDEGGLKEETSSAQEDDNNARQNVTVQEGTTGDKCVAGPVVTRAQRKMIKSTH